MFIAGADRVPPFGFGKPITIFIMAAGKICVPQKLSFSRLFLVLLCMLLLSNVYFQELKQDVIGNSEENGNVMVISANYLRWYRSILVARTRRFYLANVSYYSNTTATFQLVRILTNVSLHPGPTVEAQEKKGR